MVDIHDDTSMNTQDIHQTHGDSEGLSSFRLFPLHCVRSSVCHIVKPTLYKELKMRLIIYKVN